MNTNRLEQYDRALAYLLEREENERMSAEEFEKELQELNDYFLNGISPSLQIGKQYEETQKHNERMLRNWRSPK